MITFLDRQLGRFTMYRLVTVVLLVLAVVAMVWSAVGLLDPTIFPVGALALTLVVIVGASVATNAAVGRLVGAHPHLESSLVTALILWFLYWPSTDVATLGWLAGIAALAQISKYVLAWRGRHIVNPAAAGVVLAVLLGWVTDWPVPFTGWWVASESLFWFVLVGGLLVLHRTRRLAVGLVFAVPAALITIWWQLGIGSDLTAALEFTFYSTPIAFFGGFMLSEPLTLPPRRHQQLAVAVLAAVLFTWPLWTSRLFGEPWTFEPFTSTYELTLVVTGLVAFALRQGSRWLTLRERRELGTDVVEYVFDADRPLAFVPGQYVEVDVPHRGVDARGRRRMFSVVSAPGREVVLATRHPEPGSSYKRALAALEPADRVRVTAVHGDFVWPAEGKVLLVGAGIGVTPFLSQLSAHPGRDVVVVLGEREGQAYVPDLEAAATVVRMPVDEVDAEAIAAAVPDLAERTALVSGRPDFADTVARSLSGRVKRVKTDHFLGY